MAKRSGITAAKALARRLGVDGFASRVGVTEATARRWLRDGLPASRRDDVQGALERSERARQAALARAEQAREEAARQELAREKRNQRARDLRQQRRFEDGRRQIFKDHGLTDHRGEPITGRQGLGPWSTLAAMMRKSDPAWIAFLEFAEANGRTERQAKNEWYSPKAKKKRGPKRRKPQIGKRKKNKGRRRRKK
jgi:hypothetical protein